MLVLKFYSLRGSYYKYHAGLSQLCHTSTALKKCSESKRTKAGLEQRRYKFPFRHTDAVYFRPSKMQAEEGPCL